MARHEMLRAAKTKGMLRQTAREVHQLRDELEQGELVADLGLEHVVGRPEAVNTIMKIMGSVKDWSAAHQHELKLQRQSWQLAR